MPRNIRVIDSCYTELEKIFNEIVEDKKAKGSNSKTTFSEVVCMLIRERRA